MTNKGVYRQQDDYMAARRAGIQPKSNAKADVDAAWKATEITGTPFRADQ